MNATSKTSMRRRVGMPLAFAKLPEVSCLMREMAPLGTSSGSRTRWFMVGIASFSRYVAVLPSLFVALAESRI